MQLSNINWSNIIICQMTIFDAIGIIYQMLTWYDNFKYWKNYLIDFPQDKAINNVQKDA